MWQKAQEEKRLFPTEIDFDVYQPRNPKANAYYRCVEDHFEPLETVWDDRYRSRFGFWRPYVTDGIQRYLDCGDLHFGFARVKCEDCGHEYLLAFSCKRRHFCPSCHQKRVVEFGEWLCEEVLKHVPHRQWVFSIPKRLRVYLMFDRRLLAKLSRCAWKILNLYLTQAVPYDDAKAGAAIAVQNFNPHLHVLATDGGFYNVVAFMVCPPPDTSLENLARYIIRASFSQERMTYIPANDTSDGVSKVIYQSKDGTSTKTFDALDWLAQLTAHIPNKGEQMVRYYGFYSNKSRGLRKKAGTDNEVPALIDSDISRQAFRKNWARLIQKIYHVNPLLCPKCSGSMRIISMIDDAQIIKKILKHLDLWDVKRKPPPCANSPPPEAFIIYDQSSAPNADDYLIDAVYPIEAYH